MNYDDIGFAREELQNYIEKLDVTADISLGLFSDFDV